jgi:hypothetical protein
MQYGQEFSDSLNIARRKLRQLTLAFAMIRLMQHPHKTWRVG